jgi:hypothetical protein
MRLRKACRACTKAKRRCRAQLPQCVRCFSKGLQCVYDLEPLLQDRTSQKAEESAGRLDQVPGRLACQKQGQQVDTNPLYAFVDAQHISMHLAVKTPPAIGLRLWRPSTKSVPLQSDPATLSYLIRQLQSVPGSFLRSHGAPFLHPKLYSQAQYRQVERVHSACDPDKQEGWQVRFFHPEGPSNNASLLPADLHDPLPSVREALASIHVLIFSLIPVLYTTSPKSAAETKSIEAQLLTLIRRAEHLYSYAPSQINSARPTSA